MAITDIATFILSIFFLLRGASRGFMHSLLGPFSIIVTTVISIIYYQTTHNTIVSLLIGLIGPLLLTLLLKFLLHTWNIFTKAVINPGFLSRLGGAILTLLWGWIFIFFTLILLSVLPNWGDKLAAIHDDVTKSAAYWIIKPLENKLFGPSNQNATAVTNAVANNDAISLAQDPRFQKILQDPEIQKEINAHDIVDLMKNPKMMDLVQQIMSDPATMKKVMGVYRSQSQNTKNP